MNFTGILFISIAVEGTITYIKSFINDGKIKWEMLAALLLGVLLAVAYNLDLPGMLGLKSSIPFIGNVISGILISRGSNYMFDLVKLINQLTSKASKDN